MASDKQINIGVGADISGLKTGMNDAAKSVSELGNTLDSKLNNAAKSTDTAFKTLSQAFRVTARDAQEIALKQGTTSQAFVEAASKAREYKAQLDQVNAAIYAQDAQQVPFQRATSGFNGLGNSINQLTRELPAFTYSLQTGFMAISNNIPMFVDQINNLKRANAELSASGQPVKSVLSQIAGAVFSWNTALSVGITALTVFGAKIFDFSGDTEKAADSQKKLSEATKDANEQLKEQGVILFKRNEELRNELAAKKLGISLDEYSLQQNEIRLQQISDLLRSETELSSTREADFLKGKTIQKSKDVDIIKLNEERKQLEQLNTELRKSIQFKGELDAISNKSKTKAKTKVEVIPEFYFPEKTQFELENPFQELGKKQGIYKWNMLGDLPEQLKVAKVAMTEFVSGTDGVMNDWAAKNAEAFSKLEDAMISIGTNAFGQLGTMIGQSLAGAETNINQFFGGIADQLGSAMIAIGSAMLVGSAATAGATSPMAYGYLAGGFALKAVAGYLGSSGGSGAKGGSPSSGGGYSPNNGFSGFTPTDNTFSINSRLIGTDLLLSVQKSSKKMDRIR